MWWILIGAGSVLYLAQALKADLKVSAITVSIASFIAAAILPLSEHWIFSVLFALVCQAVIWGFWHDTRSGKVCRLAAYLIVFAASELQHRGTGDSEGRGILTLFVLLVFTLLTDWMFGRSNHRHHK